MPIHARDKCKQCSKLFLDEALQKHGQEGDGCWKGEPCHKRRHHDRYNRSRRFKYKGEQESAV